MKKPFFYLFIACCLCLFSCNLQEITFSGVENAKLNSLTQKGVEAEITVRIKNPNWLSVTVYKSDLDLSINGINMGKAAIAENVRIKGNTEAPYTFKIKSDFTKLGLTEMTKLLSIALSRQVKINIKGDIHGGSFIYRKHFPVDITQNVSL